MSAEPSIDNDSAAGSLSSAALLIGIAAFAFGALFWLAGQLSAVLVGNGWPDTSPRDLLRGVKRLRANPNDLVALWPEQSRADLGPFWLILLLFGVLLAALGYLVYHLVRFALNYRRRREFRLFRLGFASGWEVRRTLGRAAMLRKAKSVRPSTRGRSEIDPRGVGFYLGRDIRSRQELYGSVEDVFIVLAPPRQGKDVHFCAPFTIDAPGPCIVTSTRSDAFTNTYAMRAEMGKIYVFDPNGLTNWPERLRWSPVTGCENPLLAANRAAAMVKAVGLEPKGDGSYYIIGGITALRCLLHAAAVGGKTMRDIDTWVTQQISPEPVMILRKGELEDRAARGWAAALEGLINFNPRERATMFSVANQALTCFADPDVMDACSPGPDEVFDMEEFLSGRNTLYILGKEKKEGSITPVVTAMMEHLFDEARKVAARMPGSRMDPPLTVELNEAANIAPLPNLPGYMSDSGGFSIALHVYLQSLSQARSAWGDHEAMIMWDNAAIRVIMGGAGNIEDLEHVSRLIGEYDRRKRTRMRGSGGSGTAVTLERRRVLTADEIRTLEFGKAVIVARSSRPVEARLTPWWKRADGEEIAAGKAHTERLVQQYTAEVERVRKAKLFKATSGSTGRAEPGP